MTRPTIKWVFFLTLLIFSFTSGSKGIFRFLTSFTVIPTQAAAIAAATPELPRILLNTNYTAPIGRTITVNAGGDLQAAINQAVPGDIISLQAGATFTGNFTLPNKTGTGLIVIRTSTPDSSLPAQGTRVAPQNASLMPKILSPGPDAAIKTMSGAHNYRLIGLEIGLSAGSQLNYGIVCLGDGSSAQNSLSQVPQDITIDRCYIHGNSTGDVSRGVALNSGRTAIIDSFISEIHGVGLDTQAICGWNGPGPFKIVNNYLEGSGENIMFGGADPTITGLVPSDIEFRNNWVYKPLRWMVGNPSYAGIHWSVKNLFELKNAQRILVDGNTFENCWADAQVGFAFVLKSVNQDGTAPWCTTADVTITNNVIRHSGAALNMIGAPANQPGIPMDRVLIRNNLWDDINGPKWGNTLGKFLQISNSPNVIIDHNTVIQSGDLTAAYDQANQSFVFTNNIVAHGPYGVKGDGTGVGNDTLNTYFPGAMFAKNALAGGPSSLYPIGNFFPTAFDAVGFVNFAGGDYRLSSTSMYRNAGTDGQDLGYIPGGTAPSSTPTPSPSPSPTPALAISNVVSTSITDTSVTITWTTNQFTDSQIEYGTTTTYGKLTTLNPTLLTSHVEIISGLIGDTIYNFRVKSKTSGGTLAVSSNFTFRTVAMKPAPSPTPTPTPAPDTTPPTINGISVSAITSNGATINWATNEASDSQIEFGLTTAYGQATALNANPVTAHLMTLSGLNSGVLYNFRVKSRDAAGNLAVSGNFTLTTAASVTGSSVTWTNLRNVTVIGSVLKKTSGCDGCRTSALSLQRLNSGDGYLEFTALENDKQRWAGLMTAGKTVATSNLDFSIMLGNGEAAVFESGVFKTEVLYTSGDKLRIAIQGGIVRYYKNGVLFYTSSVRPTYPLLTAAWIDQMNGTIANAVMVISSTSSTLSLK